MIRVQISSQDKVEFGIRLFMGILCSLAISPIMVVYIWALYPSTPRDGYRSYVWYVAIAFYVIGLSVYLSRKRTYIFNRYKWFGLKSKLFIVLIDFVTETVWLSSQTLNCFASVSVIVRFIQSSIMNVLYNFNIAPTYGYLLSIVITLYKFSIEIESPYIALKDAICKDRQSVRWDFIIIGRERVPHVDMATIHKNKKMRIDMTFPLPMTWTVFFRIAKLMRLTRQTNRTILNAAFLMFVLFMFFISTQSYDTDILKQLGGNSSVFAIIAGTMLPLLPQITNFLGSTDSGPTSSIYASRLASSLKCLERKEELRNTLPFAYDIPSRFIPFKYVIVSALNEDKSQEMDPKFDYDKETRKPIRVDEDNIPLQ
ncbi:ispH [Acrasis kona]|uniref:IspH n=1 Tax=Acrasis kona TaxID=1008807 RepID=A0AAW2YM70_9EUKA